MTTTGEAIVAYAREQLGDPYVWGATGPNAFDCSGLVYAAYKAAGINLPRERAKDLGREGTAVAAGNASLGDIVYFDHPGDTDHVGLYIGNGQMINAPTEGKPVQVASINGATSIRHIDANNAGPANGTGLEKGGAGPSGGLLGGLFDGWQMDATNIGLKLLAGGTCAALVIVGAWEALHDKDKTA